MKRSLLNKMGAFFMAGGLVLTSMMTAYAADSTDETNDAAIKAAIAASDVIDTSRTGSLSIYKYDTTTAGTDGVYETGSIVATGEADKSLEALLSDYSIEGVEFTYLRVGDIETYSTAASQSIEIVYEIPDELRSILGLDESAAVDMSISTVANKCTSYGVYHYTSQQINDALSEILSDNNILAKNQLEEYVTSNAASVAMPLTDSNGYTGASGLELGLYLIVETAVPEYVTITVNPWFASLPFTDSDGTQWLYDMTCYPKNQTGVPTIDKLVRNAYGEAADSVGESEDYSYLIYDDGSEQSIETDSEYVTSRTEYSYASTTTASCGDILDYILVSKLPHIESTATYLTTYTFEDVLSAGLTYNQDVRIAFYTSQSDASINNTANAVAIWTDEEFDAGYAYVYDDESAKTGETKLTVAIRDKGLEIINENYSDYYMVVYYSVTVDSDASVVMGDDGNPNDVTLTWKRTSDSYYNTLEDKSVVYAFGIDINKTFSDDKGDATEVKFVLFNASDNYYVTAAEDDLESGLYYVTGKADSIEAATVFTPSAEGSLKIYGIEGDTYQLIETATDSGYSLLSDAIVITINTTTETIIASTAGTVGENSQMYEGDLVSATATVDGVSTSMSAADDSANAKVILNIINTTSFLLPQTGGRGIYLVTISGMLIFAMGCFMIIWRKRSHCRAEG